MSVARLEFHLENWKRWMKHDNVTDGYPGKAAGCVGGGYSQSFDEMVDREDVRCARIVDALVASLSPVERAAINKRYLYAVYRFPRNNYQEVLYTARLKIAGWLVMRGVY
jgi:hypothetical protein